MGIFNRGPKQTPLEKLQEAAAKHGLPTEGLVGGAETFSDNQKKFLLVFPDRIELHKLAKMTSLMGSGAGVEAIPLASISSVSHRSEGIWAYLKLTGSGIDTELRGDVATIPRVHDEILAAKRSA